MVAFDTEGRDSISSVRGQSYVATALTVQVATQTGILVMQLPIHTGEEKRELHSVLKKFLTREEILLVGSDVESDINKFKDFRPSCYDIRKSFPGPNGGRGLHFILGMMLNLCITMWKGSHSSKCGYTFWNIYKGIMDRRGNHTGLLFANSTDVQTNNYRIIDTLLESIGYGVEKYNLLPNVVNYLILDPLAALYGGAAALVCTEYLDVQEVAWTKVSIIGCPYRYIEKLTTLWTSVESILDHGTPDSIEKKNAIDEIARELCGIVQTRDNKLSQQLIETLSQCQDRDLCNSERRSHLLSVLFTALGGAACCGLTAVKLEDASNAFFFEDVQTASPNVPGTALVYGEIVKLELQTCAVFFNSKDIKQCIGNRPCTTDKGDKYSPLRVPQPKDDAPVIVDPFIVCPYALEVQFDLDPSIKYLELIQLKTELLQRTGEMLSMVLPPVMRAYVIKQLCEFTFNIFSFKEKLKRPVCGDLSVKINVRFTRPVNISRLAAVIFHHASTFKMPDGKRLSNVRVLPCVLCHKQASNRIATVTTVSRPGTVIVMQEQGPNKFRQDVCIPYDDALPMHHELKKTLFLHNLRHGVTPTDLYGVFRGHLLANHILRWVLLKRPEHAHNQGVHLIVFKTLEYSETFLNYLQRLSGLRKNKYGVPEKKMFFTGIIYKEWEIKFGKYVRDIWPVYIEGDGIHKAMENHWNRKFQRSWN
jgi:hypothetical protein